MKGLAVVTAIVLGLPLAYALVHLSLIEVGQEIVVLHKWTGDAEFSMARLWIVDEGERAWLHHGYADSAWILRLEADPIVEIDRDGETRKYRARPDPPADPKVHRLLREKYGFADRLVRFWFGNDRERGLVNQTTCKAVPVRLEPL